MMYIGGYIIVVFIIVLFLIGSHTLIIKEYETIINLLIEKIEKIERETKPSKKGEK